eukprot:TRINITY_DN17120_c0_g1_i1.p1 TRINITY_DN17120_c0_g1~~TRINITY_DN17120_c0_g1_i1.p1  ORF type:complete len:976 (-),score=197.78 TRINITY_DN17120_c0_g1_i1:235-3162(-)
MTVTVSHEVETVRIEVDVQQVAVEPRLGKAAVSHLWLAVLNIRQQANRFDDDDRVSIRKIVDELGSCVLGNSSPSSYFEESVYTPRDVLQMDAALNGQEIHTPQQRRMMRGFSASDRLATASATFGAFAAAGVHHEDGVTSSSSELARGAPSPVSWQVPGDEDEEQEVVLGSATTAETTLNLKIQHIEQVKEEAITGLDAKFKSQLEDVFRQLDQDGSGKIDRSELRKAFLSVQCVPTEVGKCIEEWDESGDEQLDIEEWLGFVQSLQNGTDTIAREEMADFVSKILERQKQDGYVYDKFRKEGWSMISHNAYLRVLWDVVLAVVLIYLSMALPLALAFGQSSRYETAEKFIQGVFAVDIFLNFRTTYVDSVGAVVKDPWRVAKRYFKSWFLLDVISAFPFEYVLPSGQGMDAKWNAAKIFKAVEIGKVVRLFRMLKCVNLLSGSLQDVLDEIIVSHTSKALLQLMVVMCLACVFCHWLACCACWLGGQMVHVYLEGDDSWFRQYLAALYWAMTTVTTVGYGDVTPETDIERLYCMFAMIAGGCFYAFVVGSISSIITDSDLHERAYSERMALIQSWLDHHAELPKRLRRRLRWHFKNSLSRKTALADSAVMSELTPELLQETAPLLAHECIRYHPLFIELPVAMLSRLVVILQRVVAHADDGIVKLADFGLGMFVLEEGKARFMKGYQWVASKKRSLGRAKRTQLVSGDSFGEEILLGFRTHYAYTIVASTAVSMELIPVQGFKESFAAVPDLVAKMRATFEEVTGGALPPSAREFGIRRDTLDKKRFAEAAAKIGSSRSEPSPLEALTSMDVGPTSLDGHAGLDGSPLGSAHGSPCTVASETVVHIPELSAKAAQTITTCERVRSRSGSGDDMRSTSPRPTKAGVFFDDAPPQLPLPARQIRTVSREGSPLVPLAPVRTTSGNSGALSQLPPPAPQGREEHEEIVEVDIPLLESLPANPLTHSTASNFAIVDV